MQRRNRRSLLVLILLTLLVLSACSALPTSIIPTAPTPTPLPPTPMPTAEAVVEATPTPTPAEPQVVVGVDSNDMVGEFLVGPKGLPLYFSLRDEPSQSNCYDQCAEIWPPLLVEQDQDPVASDEVVGAIDVFARDDGSWQVTHNGAPLYSYAGDDQPGQLRGHGIAGNWYVRLNAPPETQAILATGLQVGGKAQLTPGAHALIMHEDAGPDSRIVGYIRPADVLQVTGGPQVVADSRWYRVIDERSGTEAWVDASYLIPYRDSTLPVDSRAELAPGVEGLNIRAEAGAESPILGVVQIGDLVRVESGPEMVDGHRWYQVSNESSGISGWVHGRYLVPMPNG